MKARYRIEIDVIEDRTVHVRWDRVAGEHEVCEQVVAETFSTVGAAVHAATQAITDDLRGSR